ncbi:carbohydrate ABC transporter permease [Paenibacillus sp. Root444D2]|uniref:carbohydrate ABC transporter permease n=1 Tax=Paenibacillus sp. Root444D2 TaxID=1736538 RepID=UPI00070DB23E|nr:carbohydrate ABC transporter permease [Paenibacillus sp. Root444D2]KQX48728.1 ABC transporter permease [Paenibacillus sp. Root444D2]
MKMSKGLVITGLTLICLIVLSPFYNMIIMGTYYANDLFQGVVLLPGNYFIQNLKKVMSGNFPLFYLNSLYVAVLSTVLTLSFSALTGYAFGKFEFKGKKWLYLFILFTMMIPGQLGMIAYVIEMKFFHLNNTHMPLIIAACNNAFGVFFMTQFSSSSVPTEVLESARIDGCGELKLFYQIVVPFLMPALTTLGLLAFLWSWNNYLLPLVTINKPDLFTLPLGITTLSSAYRYDYSASILGLSLGTLPLIILFLFGNKTLVRGLTGGAVKG